MGEPPSFTLIRTPEKAIRYFAHSQYLNNIVEQVVRYSDHRFIKKITRPMLGFKSFASAEATLEGIELHQIIRKGQLDLEEPTPFEQFYALAG